MRNLPTLWIWRSTRNAPTTGKTWLTKYDRSKVLRGDCPTLTHRDFVDYELIHFSNYDSADLPSAIDRLKVSQRKIMFGCFKKKLTTEIASHSWLGTSLESLSSWKPVSREQL
jgi:hypothetical protein